MTEDHQPSGSPTRPGAQAHAGDPATLVRRKWLIRSGSVLFIVFLVAGPVRGFEPFKGAFDHWSAQVAFVGLVVALASAGEWLIGRGYRHRAGG
ncbi:MAG TPA: hypothetical protein VF755_11165 [Catenuloplanes sp.]|jgi:hypothetical protein